MLYSNLGFRLESTRSAVAVAPSEVSKPPSSSHKPGWFVSSTSVFQSQNKEVKEGDIGIPEKISGKALLTAESLFQKSDRFQTTIIRFGGLIGANRNPANFQR